MRVLPPRCISTWSTSVSMPELTCPPTTAVISGAPPLKGTCTRSSAAPLAIITPKKCGRLPGAGLPKLASFGFAAHQVVNSLIDFAGWPATTDRPNWKFARCATGVKSAAGV